MNIKTTLRKTGMAFCSLTAIMSLVLMAVSEAKAGDKSVTVAPKDKVSVGFSVHKNGETETLTFTPKSGNHFAEKPPLLEGLGDSMLWQYDAQSSSSDQKVLKVAAATSDKSLALKATVYFKVTSGGGGGGGSASPLPNANGYAHQVQIIAYQPGTLASSGSAVPHPDKDASYDYFALIRQNTDNDEHPTVPSTMDCTDNTAGAADDDLVCLELVFKQSKEDPKNGTLKLTLPDGVRAFNQSGTEISQSSLQSLLTPLASGTGGTVKIWIEAKENFTNASTATFEFKNDQDSLAATKDQVLLVPVELRDINDHSNSGDDETIIPWDKAQNISSRNIAWIDAHTSAQNSAPQMPQLELQIKGLPQSIVIEAKLEVKYDRGNGARTARNQSEDDVKIPSGGDFEQVSGDVWQIWSEYQNEDFFGGNATLTYRLKSGSTVIVPETQIAFRIGGKNPDNARCRAWIESQPHAEPSGYLWYAYAIAKSETSEYSFNGSFYNQFHNNPESSFLGFPTWNDDGPGTPGGYGIFQVTGNVESQYANIPRKQIWNWQENITGGLAELESKHTTAVNWMTRQKNSDNANGTPLPDLTVAGVTFSEGTTHTMVDAVTMKRYNGASKPPDTFVDPDPAPPGFIIDTQDSGEFCYWSNEHAHWALDRFNNPPGSTPPFNYVKRICEQVESE